ncbi:MAG TPA: arabinan endo-1,5-alpha-L-arabinosidase [Terriglobales bacterium]|jgi:arabinan endo-1,5-alpha-L-arabinosidase|nr:arabinan endo-1,5-alpha-L-arabinosidase [Terriglobales bacterium]
MRNKTVLILALYLLIPSYGIAENEDEDNPPNIPQIINVEGDVEFVHDPSIAKDGDTWYLFSTANGPIRDGELPIRCSQDLHLWHRCGTVFDKVPDWIKKESPVTKELWAPDISYFNGEFHLYYAFSVFGKNTSGIALLTNKTLNPKSPDFHWVDHGLVLQSRVEDDFNAIDPNLVLDEKGQPWLSFGSFWTGIKMRRIDVKTGLLSAEDTKVYSIATRKRPDNPGPNPPGLPGNWQAIEAPFIIHHGDYYYLFVSFDLCCRGIKSTYKTMVARARSVTGPYVDAAGTPMLEGGGTPLLLGNTRWFGPGGESILQQKDGDIIVFHAYDGKTGAAYLQISTIAWIDGWPKVALEAGNPANH